MADIIETLAEIRHEIKTPVNIISSNAELISMMCNADKMNAEDIEKRMQSIRYYCRRIEMITDSVLSASKIIDGKSSFNCTNGNIEEFFASLVNNATEYFNLYNVKISVKPKLSDNIFCCDYSVLEQIVMNIIINGIKYNKKQIKRIGISLEDNDREMNIKIKDNGIGIDEDDLDKIFDKFYRCENGKSISATGTGLGLFIVKNLVETLGGKISVKSPQKKGTEFTITMPKNIKVTNKFSEVSASDYFHPNLIKSYLTSLSDFETAKKLGLDF